MDMSSTLYITNIKFRGRFIYLDSADDVVRFEKAMDQLLHDQKELRELKTQQKVEELFERE